MLGRARFCQEVAVPLACNGEGVLGAVTLVAIAPHEGAVVELARSLVARATASAVGEAT